MILKKITTGFVVQEFDTDSQQWIHQSFVAGDQVEYETNDGDAINETDFDDRNLSELYLPLEMKQPSEILN